MVICCTVRNPHCERVVLMDKVKHPHHYKQFPVEVIDIIQLVLARANLDPFQSYCLGNELKYRLRAGFKGDTTEDINKALEYYSFRNKAASEPF